MDLHFSQLFCSLPCRENKFDLRFVNRNFSINNSNKCYHAISLGFSIIVMLPICYVLNVDLFFPQNFQYQLVFFTPLYMHSFFSLSSPNNIFLLYFRINQVVIRDSMNPDSGCRPFGVWYDPLIFNYMRYHRNTVRISFKSNDKIICEEHLFHGNEVDHYYIMFDSRQGRHAFVSCAFWEIHGIIAAQIRQVECY